MFSQTKKEPDICKRRMSDRCRWVVKNEQRVKNQDDTFLQCSLRFSSPFTAFFPACLLLFFDFNQTAFVTEELLGASMEACCDQKLKSNKSKFFMKTKILLYDLNQIKNILMKFYQNITSQNANISLFNTVVRLLVWVGVLIMLWLYASNITTLLW